MTAFENATLINRIRSYNHLVLGPSSKLLRKHKGVVLGGNHNLATDCFEQLYPPALTQTTDTATQDTGRRTSARRDGDRQYAKSHCRKGLY